MPFGDGTGPMGAGPRTGRGAGFCTGSNRAGYVTGGFGRGRGWRNWFRATGLPFWARQQSVSEFSPIDNKQELEILRNQAENLKTTLKNIEKRVSELAGKETTE